jgi:hypothetical protein
MSTPETGVQEWRDIDWPKVESDVHCLQRRIYRVSLRPEEDVRDRDQPTEEPCEAKVSSTVLKTNPPGD